MAARFLFYDLETSGLDKSFDQVLQFAAIETDLALRPLHSYEWWVKLRPDVWPSPQALAVTGISLNYLSQHGLPEYEVIGKIHALFNRPDTITLGYNTLGFDDEFLRFSFHRNLFDPYTHQYANGCRRMDIYPMTLMRYLLAPEGICWPKIKNKEDGDWRISMKLEHLREANQLPVDGNSHNAMSDVICTIEMARLLMQNQKVWEQSAAYFLKNYDEYYVAEHSKAAGEGLSIGIWVDGGFGGDRHYLSVACCLGKHHHYLNQELWLRLDLAELPQTPEEIERSYRLIVRKKLGEAPFMLPFEPFYGQMIEDERKELIKSNLERLRKGFSLWQKYWLEYKYAYIPNLDLDACLYQRGFLSPKEKELCAKLHLKLQNEQCDGQYSPDFLSQEAIFSDYREQFIRILGRNYPHLLVRHAACDQLIWKEYLTRAVWGEGMVNFKGHARRSAMRFYEEWLACDNLSTKQQRELAELYARRRRGSVYKFACPNALR